MTLAKEVRTLVPKQILERAQKLAENGLYDKALELLERNKMEFEIYDTFISLRMPKTQTRSYHFTRQAPEVRR